MKVKTIKKDIGHEAIISRGFKLVELKKGWFARENKKIMEDKKIMTLVLVYSKPGWKLYYNRFGLLQTIGGARYWYWQE